MWWNKSCNALKSVFLYFEVFILDSVVMYREGRHTCWVVSFNRSVRHPRLTVGWSGSCVSCVSWNITPRFLTWGFTRVDRLPRLLVVSLMESGGPNNITFGLHRYCSRCIKLIIRRPFSRPTCAIHIFLFYNKALQHILVSHISISVSRCGLADCTCWQLVNLCPHN